MTGQQWVGAVLAALITVSAALLTQIGTWAARTRRSLQADLEILKGLPMGSLESNALTWSINRRTQDLVVRTNTESGRDGWLFVTIGLVSSIVTAVALLSGEQLSSPDKEPLTVLVSWGLALFYVAFGIYLWVSAWRRRVVLSRRLFEPDTPILKLRERWKARIERRRLGKSGAPGSPTADPELAAPDSAATSPGDQTAAVPPRSSRRERWRSRWRRLRGA